jgi:hypothetical protein
LLKLLNYHFNVILENTFIHTSTPPPGSSWPPALAWGETSKVPEARRFGSLKNIMTAKIP